MERRREPRFDSGQTVELTVLDGGDGSADRSAPAMLVEISNNGARLMLTERLHVGQAIRVDAHDSILLGEVCHCSAVPGGYMCGLQLDQALSGVGDLTKLMQAILGAADTAEEEELHPVRLRRRQPSAIRVERRRA